MKQYFNFPISLLFTLALVGCGPTYYDAGNYFFPDILVDGNNAGKFKYYKREGVYNGQNVYSTLPDSRSSEAQAGVLTVKTKSSKTEIVVKPLNDKELQEILAIINPQQKLLEKKPTLTKLNPVSSNNSSKKIASLESKLKSLSGSDYVHLVNRYENYRCYGWGGKYPDYKSCMDVTGYDSTAWESFLEENIQSIERQNSKKRDDAARQERCLSNGPIGICQSSKQNELMFLCDTNPIVALNNLGNQYCYTTDNFNIVTNMLVRNNTSGIVRDITFTCQQIANSGTVLGQGVQTVYDAWKPGEVRTVKLKFLKVDQVKSVNCSPSRWKN